ncbi:MAG: PQQ-binding-like beta-propeller repeat protein, partial [Planctomycetes bacterium]|nr:PQQ-binding-like beta-propeller repeat protein [Planctomycetota bacterium]
MKRSFLLAAFVLLSAGQTHAQESPRETAERLLRESGVQGGLIVLAGWGDGQGAVTLGSSDRFVVQCLESDAERVQAVRERIRQAGLYGPVSVMRWTGPSCLPYADDMINLLLVQDPRQLDDDEILRVLVPRGIAYVKQADGPWRRIAKPWPDGMDAWSHWNHGPDGNPVSQDELVGPPRRTQWIDGPSWSKKHWGPRISALVTAGGRLFCVQDETPTSLFNIDARWELITRDAFNGVVLWRRDLPDWTGKGWGPVVRRGGDAPETALVLGLWGELTGGSGVRDAMDVMVADDRHLYVPLTVSAPLSAIDAATGTVLRDYAQVAPVEKVVLTGGVLLIGGSGKVCAVRAETGESLWETSGNDPCTVGALVFVLDRKGKSIAGVDLNSGTRRWETGFAEAMEATGGPAVLKRDAFAGPLQAGAGIVLVGVGDRNNVQTVAFSAADGRPLWRSGIGDRPFGRGGGPFIIEDLVWSLDAGKGILTALDPRSGEPVQQTDAAAIRYTGHHARCYLARATCRFIIGKERGADFVDLDSGEVSWNNWLRGPCHRGVLPANGLLYAGQHSCRCYTESALHGFHALAPEGRSVEQPDRERSELEIARLEPGPAYGAVDPSSVPSVSTSDWPTFRHDAMRSGATPEAFPARPAAAWVTDLGGKLSAPVVAAGHVYVAAVDRHEVYSLDSETGAIVWRYTTGARIDTPP